MSNLNQINTDAATTDERRLPYKQEVGGSSPSAPTTSQSLTPPPVQDDSLPGEGSGSLSDTFSRPAHVCPCGKPSDGWPGERSAELCQDCWEAYCSETWWRAHNAYASQAPPRYRAIVFTGAIQGDTQTAHQQATFPDRAAADQWLVKRVNATGKEGVLLMQREEALKCYRPEVK